MDQLFPPWGIPDPAFWQRASDQAVERLVPALSALTGALSAPSADTSRLRALAEAAYEQWARITDPAQAAATGPHLISVLKQIDHPRLLATVEHYTSEATQVVTSWSPPDPQDREPGPQRLPR